MFVSNSKVILSFCNELNFKYQAKHLYFFRAYYDNHNLINLYSYDIPIARRDLSKNITIVANKYYDCNISLHVRLLRGAVNNKIIYVREINELDKYNLKCLLDELSTGYFKCKIDNLIAFLNYFKIDKSVVEYKKAKELLDAV